MTDWEADRAALEARELAFTEFLDRRGLVLRTDLLGVWAAWLTPVFEPRRYRTWFFVADLPEGQRTRDVSTESDQVTWLPAMQAVTRRRAASRCSMLPPTYLTCLEVGQYADPAAVLDAARDRSVEMFMPEVEETDEGGTLSIPDAARATAAGVARSVSWAGGAFGERAHVRARAQRQHDDPRRHQHLGAPRAGCPPLGRGRPRPARRVPPRRRGRAGRRGGRRAADPPPPRPLRGGQGVRRADGLRRTRPRPGVPPRLRGSRRRRRGRGRRPRGARGRDPRPHRRLAVVRAAGRARRAHRRHRARAAAPPSWRTPTASSAPTSTPSTGCTRSPSRARSAPSGRATGR